MVDFPTFQRWTDPRDQLTPEAREHHKKRDEDISQNRQDLARLAARVARLED